MSGANSFAWVYALKFDENGCSIQTEINDYWDAGYNFVYDQSISPAGGFYKGGSSSLSTIKQSNAWTHFDNGNIPTTVTIEFSVPGTSSDFTGDFALISISENGDTTIGSIDFALDPVPSGTKCKKVTLPLTWLNTPGAGENLDRLDVTDWGYNRIDIHRITFDEDYPVLS